MLKRIQITFFLLIIAFASYGQEQRDSSTLDIEKFVTRQLAAQNIPGLSIGYLKGDKMWVKGFGYADLENKSFATEHSMYRLASVTKPMTATAILQLVEQGKVDLDAEVQTYVPYFPKKKYLLTVRHLLGHLGGIGHYRDYDKEGHFKYPKNTKESLAVFQDWDLVVEPGTQFNYSSYGYNLLGAVIEGASGMPYGVYMRKHVWDPLGMKTIVMDDPRAIIPNRVRGYDLSNGKLQNSEFVDISSRFAAGGTRASVIDMLRFGKGLIDGKVLKPESLDLMFESMVTRSGEKTFYGAGIGTYPINGRYTLSHSGSQQETATHLYIFPYRDLVIAVAINLEGADRVQFVSELFFAVTGEEWEVRQYPSKDAFLQFMNSAFVFGRSYFEKHGKAAIASEAATAEFLNAKTLSEKELEKRLISESVKPSPAYEKVG
ncbi:MAG: beta-lactamase family protein, partial [Acidobacteriota bacterium]|nr:beta-lactamase family protein [Acidobacteriota bacterium]